MTPELNKLACSKNPINLANFHYAHARMCEVLVTRGHVCYTQTVSSEQIAIVSDMLFGRDTWVLPVVRNLTNSDYRKMADAHYAEDGLVAEAMN